MYNTIYTRRKSRSITTLLRKYSAIASSYAEKCTLADFIPTKEETVDHNSHKRNPFFFTDLMIDKRQFNWIATTTNKQPQQFRNFHDPKPIRKQFNCVLLWQSPSQCVWQRRRRCMQTKRADSIEFAFCAMFALNVSFLCVFFFFHSF